MTALMPRSLSARVRMTAVVRLPMAPSVPSTAMRGQVTLSMSPVNMRRSFFARGRRTSLIRTPYFAAAAVNSRSSFRNSCRPLTMCMPRRIASSTTPRWCGESRPLRGATPRMKKSGTWPARAMASARSAQIGIPLGTSSRYAPESSPALVLSITERISYFSECRTRPLAVLPSGVPKNASEYTTAVLPIMKNLPALVVCRRRSAACARGARRRRDPDGTCRRPGARTGARGR